jgi:hypothetical protein
MNTKFDPSEPTPVEARYVFSDGHTIERAIGLPAAYSVTHGGFSVMILTGVVLTFTRKT